MGGFFIPEVGIEKGVVTMYQPKNEALVAVKCQDLGVVCNSLVLCLFMVDGAEWALTGVTEMFNAITGWNYTRRRTLMAGRRTGIHRAADAQSARRLRGRYRRAPQKNVQGGKGRNAGRKISAF